jgi:hypothetical protein
VYTYCGVNFVKMQLVGVTLAALAGLATGESLKRLDTSLTILTNNDLQGMFGVYPSTSDGGLTPCRRLQP